MSGHKLEVFATEEEVHRRGAELIREAGQFAYSEREYFGLAVSGGRDPWPMFSQLEDGDLPWKATEIFQVDERVAPAGSDERNLTHLVESLSIGAQGSIRPMPVTDEDLEAAANRYAEQLPDGPLDLAHLGIGRDGHTASLVPGDPVLEVTDKRVAVTGGEYQGVHRMTLTYPEINRVRKLLWVVTGEEKVDALRKLIAQDPSTPSGAMRPEGDSLILADRAAVPNA
ncbi:MAG TPA: 6-phosphogluconolactonase [Solirubrobacterales bacterium]|nr:6-phosphogluconolactonase [Solirubrobacterales bacterium]